jgi:hypothetical protein
LVGTIVGVSGCGQAEPSQPSTLPVAERGANGDTDGDGLSDRQELRRYHTNPRKRDTDGDGLNDRDEVRRYHTNPRKRDTDGDSFGDRTEIRAATNPRNRRSHPGFPDQASTGVPAGTVLAAYTGPSTISTPNTVIVGKTMGCITVSAPGVVIRNSRISCRGDAIHLDDRSFSEAATRLLVEDSELDCQNEPGTNGIAEADFIARRLEVTRCENGFDVNQNVLIEDSYIHDLWDGPTSHLDGVQLAGAHWDGSAYVCCSLNVTIRHNTIYGMGDGDSTFGTSSIISVNHTADDTNILVENNLLAGGSYNFYCPGYKDNGAKGVNYRIIDNQFSTRFKPTVGFYGISSGCADETQSGNVIHETGRPLRLR